MRNPLRPTRRVHAHCDIPCGIYDPAQARIEAESCYKIIEKYNGSSDELLRARCIDIKEERAELTKHHIDVLWHDYFKPEHLEKFPDLHDVCWKASKAASKVKQTTDLEAAKELLGLIDKIDEMWRASGGPEKTGPSLRLWSVAWRWAPASPPSPSRDAGSTWSKSRATRWPRPCFRGSGSSSRVVPTRDGRHVWERSSWPPIRATRRASSSSASRPWTPNREPSICAATPPRRARIRVRSAPSQSKPFAGGLSRATGRLRAPPASEKASSVASRPLEYPPAVSIRVTPKGTRGTGFPRFMRVGMRLGAGWMVRQYRRKGTAMRVDGRPLLLVTTVGARSGERRQVLLGRFPDGESATSWIVTGTAGGSAAHPAWFLNMARNPDRVWVETDGREIRVRPESLEGAERDAAWERIVALAPSFGRYPKATDRLIPVVRLTATE